MNMETKIAPAMTVIVIELKTNMANLVKDVGDLNRELVIEAVKAGFHPTGPQYWIYQWLSIDPKADFQLKLALPIAEFGGALNDDKFKVERLSEFKHLMHVHEGPWEKLEISYNSMMDYIKNNQIQPGTMSREVYTNCDFINTLNNRTEIQFGIN